MDLIELKEIKSLPPLLAQVAAQAQCVVRLLQLDGNAVIEKLAEGPNTSPNCLSAERCKRIAAEWCSRGAPDEMTCSCGHTLRAYPIYHGEHVNGILTVCPATPESDPLLTCLASVISNCLSLARDAVGLWSQYSNLLSAHRELYRETEALIDAEAVPNIALTIIQKYLTADVGLYLPRNAHDTGWGEPIALNEARADEQWLAALSEIVRASHDQDQCPLIILEENQGHYPQFAELRLSSFISATVLSESKTLGRFAFCSRGGAPALTFSDLALLENLSSTISLRIHDLRSRKLKERFLEHALHQINSPAHSVLAAAEQLARADMQAEERAALLSDLTNEAKRLARLVRQARDFSIVQKPARPRTALSLRQLVSGIAIRQGRLAEQHRVRIETEVPDEACEVVADGEALYSALQSLVENALKFSPPRALIRIALSKEDGGYRVSVTDEGPGVPESQRAEIFEDMVSIARPGVGESTGMGLAIARAAVEAHGGTLDCFDAPDQRGACFSFKIPLAGGDRG